MDRIDLRKLNADEMFAVKKQVVRLKKLEKSGAETEELTGVSECAVSRIWQIYLKEGNAGIKPKKTGRKHGGGRKLSAEQEREIRRTIIDKTPDQLKFGGMLWTRQSISDYIYRAFKVRLALNSISIYLERWGLTCQRPTKRAYSQDDVRVRTFKDKEYPAIAKRAKAENAEIYWGDEVGVCNTANYERGYSLKGQPPVLKIETKKESISMISAITNRGHLKFMIYDNAMNQQRLIEFMRRLVADSSQKVFLILDNLRVHHGKIVTAWLVKHKDKIEVFFIPPYSPELNPDEYLNNALKRDVHSGKHPRTKRDLKRKTRSFMKRLQHKPEKVARFFRHPNLQYIIATV